jgi:hypothetical protein
MMTIYVVKMACVFMLTTSTIALYTAIAPRWLAILGYILALLLLFGSSLVSGSFASIIILADNWRRSPAHFLSGSGLFASGAPSFDQVAIRQPELVLQGRQHSQ